MEPWENREWQAARESFFCLLIVGHKLRLSSRLTVMLHTFHSLDSFLHKYEKKFSPDRGINLL
jgi:hypothetical protein